jgi:hypothetical protein
VALAVVAGLVLAWFGIVRPTIEDTVADEVDAQTATQGTIPSQPDGSSSDTTETTVAQQPDESLMSGEPTFFRLAVAAPLTQTADTSTTMPDGEEFDMTDVRIENPFNDRGIATLLVNGEAVFVWSLENVRGSLFEPRITPIRLQPGDIVAFSVRCDEIGDATRATCTNAVNVGGETITSS